MFRSLLFLAFLMGIIPSDSSKKGTQYHFQIPDTQQWRTGDLIFRRGNGLVSDQVAFWLNSSEDITHTGMLEKVDGEWKVWHSVSRAHPPANGIVCDPLEQFARESKGYQVKVNRPPLSESQIRRALHFIQSHHQQQTPFDDAFDHLEDQKLYCTELIIHALHMATGSNEWMLEKPVWQKSVLSFEPLLDSCRFQRISGW